MDDETTSGTGQPVSLTQMLAAREQRAARQQAALARHALPVVSLSVVMPGPVKSTPLTRSIRDIAVTALAALFAAKQWPIRSFAPTGGSTGPEALYVIDCDALALKQALAELEDTHPLGRLWDIDVLCPERGQIGRRDLGRAPRRCLICNGDAHACARSQRHPLADLQAVIEEKVDAYRRQQPE
ncbi:citrate lyase holo-[acyl-carrier protein] synthase [Telmatospirillum sp.]|uniref:citrate lyase holo-[acyl-carrier protein] synthase n=1 Tax=Telmatospirillum sp. TaxID=2079197 RepID=UPI00284FD94A|nr:citrate lyase holo-[acyl-carrier protein] synthase [Telmatospirillum sp.]MDR3437795.1 citrate lyase holo-[acyl-carrier protein] synthase [Telmatospirillum sp.]